MTRRTRSILLGLALLSAVAASERPASAQTFDTRGYATCVPGIGCSQVRFFLEALEPNLFLNSLTLTLFTDSWRFLPNSGFGTYVAQDDVGPFGGSTNNGMAGRQLFIDFTETGAPFTLFDSGNRGYIDLEVDNLDGRTNTGNLYFAYNGMTDGQEVVSGTVTPEPVTLSLLGTGLLGVAGAARRRKRREQAEA